ncbi:MAG: hypothetical protein M3P04_11895, partial [Actinomycetota bacterium]|nr:hypothetical protein [Actinomycetota bacterium]
PGRVRAEVRGAYDTSAVARAHDSIVIHAPRVARGHRECDAGANRLWRTAGSRRRREPCPAPPYQTVVQRAKIHHGGTPGAGPLANLARSRRTERSRTGQRSKTAG